MSLQRINLKEIETEWPKIKNVVSYPHTKKQYNKMINYLDDLIDEIGDEQNHPLASLMETLGALIEVYENQNIPIPNQDSVSTLKFLMKEHGLKQKDLKEIGSQGVVSEILNRKRVLNTRQIQALSNKFNVSPSIFV
ncbi:MAG: helix-turn-helix domain-containing protein [Candidatus Marinimicrobia bacterium]|nr:helix-turn-helix domain-containing protein [Candidatus Neomarinimicrobiota bacterium]MBT4753232.1 helix-turn-helix domain-containing protein [Candidatus Neomarinimicrobiota bacterium]MBT6796326.1 helix-turn-helix domain-containing protein [Candidatus Neomarinimicrobiota bacterium]